GLLQALQQLRVLPLVHYLSTVSGGGYVGGFWTTWLHRKKSEGEAAGFPPDKERYGGEGAEIRHLREFSRFLLPRVGVQETEFWGIVMTVLGGMVPSLLAAGAVLLLAWCAYVLVAGTMALEGIWGVAALSGWMGTYLFGTEHFWKLAGKS